MRNDTQLKVTCKLNEEKKEELYFDYFDTEGTFVGEFVVNAQGGMKWDINNALYKDTINYSLSYILGEQNEKLHEDRMNEENIDRWGRTLSMIKERNLYVNYNQHVEFSDEYKRDYIR